MKKIEILDKVIAKEIPYTRAINHTIYNAYKDSLRNKQETLDFSECVWDKDIEPIIQICKENGIEEITLSTTFSGLLEVLENFANHGCEIVGLTKVNYIEYGGNIKKIPAMKIKMSN